LTQGYKWPFNCNTQFLEFYLVVKTNKDHTPSTTELQSCRMNLTIYILFIDLLAPFSGLEENTFVLFLSLRNRSI